MINEDLDCSLIFRLRQQDRPKNSTDVHGVALSRPASRPALRRWRQPRTGRLRVVLCSPPPSAISTKSIQTDALGVIQYGCRSGSRMHLACPQRVGARCFIGLSGCRNKHGKRRHAVSRQEFRGFPPSWVLHETVGTSSHTSTALHDSKFLMTLMA